MELFGPEATPGRAHSIARAINQMWTASYPDGYAVRCNIIVRLRSAHIAASKVVQIEAVKIAGPSHVNMSDRSMTLNANEPEAFSWTAAHEFGHVLGLQDRYSESIMSQIVGRLGGTRTTTVHPQYKSNLMAVVRGRLERQNLRDLADENMPAWLDQDDRVRAWLRHHAIQDISALSAAQKVVMVQTLADGWVAEEDLAGIVRLCAAAKTRAQADALRAAIDPLSFSDLGQRTRLRTAFANMP
jgi:hypothetical protein